MKNFLNKIINKGFGRTNFVPKFVRFTGKILTQICSPKISSKTNCIDIADLKNKSRKAEFPITQATKQVNNFNDNLKNLTESGERTTCKQYFNYARKVAFTLAEVLITITIIGVVAAMTIPIITSKIQDFQFRMAYKKAYADINQATRLALANGELTTREGTFDYSGKSTTEEFNVLKNSFKVAKECSSNNLWGCWVNAETLCTGACNGAGGKGVPYKGYSSAFIDITGRVWAEYTYFENIFVVDTNGNKAPNRFGKDRFIFVFADSKGNRINQALSYRMVAPLVGDTKTVSSWCHYPPCYYKSWLK